MLNCAKALVQSGANVNSKDKGGSVPLHYACHSDQEEVALYLTSVGANIYEMNMARKTCLDLIDNPTGVIIHACINIDSIFKCVYCTDVCMTFICDK